MKITTLCVDIGMWYEMWRGDKQQWGVATVRYCNEDVQKKKETLKVYEKKKKKKDLTMLRHQLDKRNGSYVRQQYGLRHQQISWWKFSTTKRNWLPIGTRALVS